MIKATMAPSSPAAAAATAAPARLPQHNGDGNDYDDGDASSWLPPEPLYLSALRSLLPPLLPSSAGAALKRAADEAARSAQSLEALDLAPSWLLSPDSDPVAVPDGLIGALWPAVRARLEASAVAQARALLPPGVALEALSLGAAPLRLGGVRTSSLGGGGGGGRGGAAPPEDAAVIEYDLMWAPPTGDGDGGDGDDRDAFAATFSLSLSDLLLQRAASLPSFLRRPLAALAPRLLPRALRVTLAEPQLLLRARLTLRPITPDPPFVGSVSLTLLSPPHVDWALRLFGGPPPSFSPSSSSPSSLDAMALPLVGPLGRSLARRLLAARLGYPRCLCVELSPGGSRPPAPAGVLRLRVLRAEGLKQADGGIAPAQRPFVAVEVRDGRAQRTAACPRRTNHPTWGGGGGKAAGGGASEGELLDFVVDDPRRQRLVVAVCEEGAAGFPGALSRALGLGGGGVMAGAGLLGPEGARVLGAAQIHPLAGAAFVRDLPGETVPLGLVLRRPQALLAEGGDGGAGGGGGSAAAEGGGGGGEQGAVVAPPPAAAAQQGEAASSSLAAAAAAASLQMRGTLFLEATYLPFEAQESEKDAEEGGTTGAAALPPLALLLSLLAPAGRAAASRPWCGGGPALSLASAAAAPGRAPDPLARGFLTVAVDRAGDLAFGKTRADDADVCVELRVCDPLPAPLLEAQTAGGKGGGGGGGAEGQAAPSSSSGRRLVQRTSVARGEPAPRWCEKRDFAFVSASSVLVATVLDVQGAAGGGGGGGFGGGRSLGRARVAVSEAVAAGGRARRRLPLSGALTGFVELSLEWTPLERLAGL